MRKYLYCEAGFVEKSQWLPNSWVNVVCPDANDFEFLTQELQVPESFLNDIADTDERPRTDTEGNWLLTILRIPVQSNQNGIPFRGSRNLVGIDWYVCKNTDLCFMETNQLEVLAQIVLPSEILTYFSVSSVEQTSTEIHIHLDEQMNPELSHDIHFESKGFMEAVSVTDFPIRDHKVILKIRRRRWTDIRTGNSFSIPIHLDVVCKGTRYSKEFGAFLKETYGDIPGDLPYA